MKIIIRSALALAALGVLLQLVHPGIPAGPTAKELQVPPHIHQILQKDCYSCHSNEPRLSWFDQIEPGYFLVRKDVLTARERLNFSTLGSKPQAAQMAELYEAVNMIQFGAMPLPSFLALHHESRVSQEELADLKAYLAPWAPPKPTTATQTVAVAVPQVKRASLQGVKEEWNGASFDPSFENWKVLSFTDRGDNNSFRLILGNDIAIRAADSGSVTPWPDGARFAKVGWQKKVSDDGTVRPGDFIQVEFMYKDAHEFRSTQGWNWGRWRGLDLKPYGTGAAFVTECTGCHEPMKHNDHVYTLPLTDAHVPGVEVVNNRAAALPVTLPYQPLKWSPITMFVDPQVRTESTLYGNEVAMGAARNSSSAAPSYADGSVVALVTWAQRDDPHWFGARIPNTPLRVEFLTFAGASGPSYQRFDGPSFSQVAAPSAEDAKGKALLSSLTPLQMP